MVLIAEEGVFSAVQVSSLKEVHSPLAATHSPVVAPGKVRTRTVEVAKRGDNMKGMMKSTCSWGACELAVLAGRCTEERRHSRLRGRRVAVTIDFL